MRFKLLSSTCKSFSIAIFYMKRFIEKQRLPSTCFNATKTTQDCIMSLKYNIIVHLYLLPLHN